jgi:AmiR/NasT family two-component response regulator
VSSVSEWPPMPRRPSGSPSNTFMNTDTRPRPPNPAKTPPDLPALAPRHLMLVDDDRLVLATVGPGLRSAGYQVSTAESMAEAETLLAHGLLPDLVIVDVRMPHGGGLTLAERLRERGNLPFVMFSAYRDTDTVRSASALGALGYLVKPMVLEQMLPTIESALSRGADLRALATNAAQLQQALRTEHDVCVAVGITMAQQHLSRQAALDTLRKTSRAKRRKLADLSSDLVQTTNRLHET